MAMRIERDNVRKLLREENAQLVEVLPRQDYEEEHIAGAISIPLKELDREAPLRLDRRRPVIAYCWDYLCDLSARAATRLEQLGFDPVFHYQPGKADWMAAGLPREGRAATTRYAGDI